MQPVFSPHPLLALLHPHQQQLSQLEGELAKVKATIKELDTEVTALRGERSQAVGILQEIQGKLRVSHGVGLVGAAAVSRGCPGRTAAAC